ncbi:hypothetical protein BD769DRAFT_1664817 [Suillus cothurnatus]|nr:hypothetical protein BD769DRAFT_1664817 [Suillus cothurnatus]
MLKLVGKGDFVMEFPLKMLKEMISHRKEAAGQENLSKDDEELVNMKFEGVRSTMVLHVHGGPVLSRKEREGFEKHSSVRFWMDDHAESISLSRICGQRFFHVYTRV